MTKLPTVLFTIWTLFVFSCGNSESSTTDKIDTTRPQIVDNSLNNTIDSTAETVLKPLGEKELIQTNTEVLVEGKKAKELTERQAKQNFKSPKPVKANQKIEKPATDEVTPSISPLPNKGVKIEENNTEAAIDKEAVNKTGSVVKAEPTSQEKPVALSHELFDQLLKKYVSAKGNVNYSGFKTEETKLDAYLKILEENPPADDWSKNKKMAYWINAYNAATIKLILKNYPVSSITKLHGGKPWDQQWIQLGGKTYSLNHIENGILRPVYKEARIHFAVNCAAKSCPPLLNKAWTESNLSQNLDKQTRAFINDPSQNKISPNAVEISKIFEWYAADFGNIIDFLNKYSTTKINPGAKVTYKEYNWDLNK